MAPFLETLSTRKDHLRSVLEKFSKEIETVSRDTKFNVTMEDSHPNAFLIEAISPIYEKCGKLKGLHSHHVRLALLENAISEGEQFTKITSGIKKAIEDALHDRQLKLLHDIHRIFDGIMDDFDSMCSVEEIQNAQRDALRARTQIFVKKAKDMINGAISEALAKAETDSA